MFCGNELSLKQLLKRSAVVTVNESKWFSEWPQVRVQHIHWKMRAHIEKILELNSSRDGRSIWQGLCIVNEQPRRRRSCSLHMVTDCSFPLVQNHLTASPFPISPLFFTLLLPLLIPRAIVLDRPCSYHLGSDGFKPNSST